MVVKQEADPNSQDLQIDLVVGIGCWFFVHPLRY